MANLVWWLKWEFGPAVHALVIGLTMGAVAITAAYAANNMLRGCDPWAPPWVIVGPGVKLCPGQVAVGVPLPKPEGTK